MTPKLTDEMRKALKNKSAQPVTVEDELTHVHYVLLPLDEYEKIFDDSPFSIEETYTAQSRVAGAAGWDDPAMDVYNNYDLHKKSV